MSLFNDRTEKSLAAMARTLAARSTMTYEEVYAGFVAAGHMVAAEVLLKAGERGGDVLEDVARHLMEVMRYGSQVPWPDKKSDPPS